MQAFCDKMILKNQDFPGAAEPSLPDISGPNRVKTRSKSGPNQVWGE